jgi:hypothetical protein
LELFLVQARSVCRRQFFMEIPNLVDKAVQPLPVGAVDLSPRYFFNRVHLKRFPQFVEFKNILAIELSDDRSAVSDLFQNSFADQLSDRLANRCTAAIELFRE